MVLSFKANIYYDLTDLCESLRVTNIYFIGNVNTILLPFKNNYLSVI
jgi:hypothetical protein